MNVFKTFGQIYEGWKNDLFPAENMKEEIFRISEERLLICQECPENSNRAKLNGYKTIRTDYHCINCLCPLHKKTKSLSSECPLGKWKAVASIEEDDELKRKLNIKE